MLIRSTGYMFAQNTMLPKVHMGLVNIIAQTGNQQSSTLQMYFMKDELLAYACLLH